MATHLYVLIDPQRAPETAENIRDYVRQYGFAGMTTTVRNLNSKEETNRLRGIATGHLPKRSDRAWDEEPPADFRKPGDPFTLRNTSRDESRYQGGVLGRTIRYARKLGPDTVVTHGIKGEDLAALGSPNPAATAKLRHQQKARKN